MIDTLRQEGWIVFTESDEGFISEIRTLPGYQKAVETADRLHDSGIKCYLVPTDSLVAFLRRYRRVKGSR